MDNGPNGVRGIHAVRLVEAERNCQDVVALILGLEVGRIARVKVSEPKTVMVLNVEHTGRLGPNGVNAAEHAPLGIE